MNKEPTEPDVIFERQWNLDVSDGESVIETHAWTERILKSDRVPPGDGGPIIAPRS